jgi:D-alanine-D-alanine ligase
MDKVVAKQIFAQVGLPSLDFEFFTATDWQEDERAVVDKIEKRIAYDCFVKPANMGSSVGISKAHNQVELIVAIRLALRYDSRVLVEKAAKDFYEIECSVLGNDKPIASVPGEIVPCNEFYDYNAKYLADGSKILIPAPGLDEEKKSRVRELAITAYRALDASGLARVDFLVAKQSADIWINEVNTLPGFTPISMYPKMWEATGVDFDELVHRLVQFGLERSQRRNKLAEAAGE